MFSFDVMAPNLWRIWATRGNHTSTAAAVVEEEESAQVDDLQSVSADLILAQPLTETQSQMGCAVSKTYDGTELSLVMSFQSTRS